MAMGRPGVGQCPSLPTCRTLSSATCWPRMTLFAGARVVVLNEALVCVCVDKK